MQMNSEAAPGVPRSKEKSITIDGATPQDLFITVCIKEYSREKD
jgi:hypothetical protein